MDVIDTRPPLSRSAYIVVTILLVAIAYGYQILVTTGNAEIGYLAFYSNEGILESVGALACILSTWLFLASFFRFRSRTTPTIDQGRPARAGYYFALALVSLTMFGEELGWGSRLAQWLSPSADIVGEWSLADLIQPARTTFPVVMTWWGAALVTYLGVVPIVAGWMTGLGSAIRSARFPLPSRAVGRMMLATALVAGLLAFRPQWVYMGHVELGEAFELAMEILVLLWSIEEYAWVCRSIPAGRSVLLAVTMATSVAVAVLAGGFDFATRTYPASQSQRLYAIGRQLEADEEIETAINYYRESVASFPANDAAQYALGVLLDRQGRLAESIPHLQAAVRVGPNIWEYQHALAVGYAKVWTGPAMRQSIVHLDRALELIDKEHPLRPDLMQLHDTLVTFRRAGEHAARNPEAREKIKAWQAQMREKMRATQP